MPGGEHRGDCGEQIERFFAAEDFLQTVPDDRALLEARFRLHPDHLVEHQLAVREGRWTVQVMTLRPTSGIMFHANVDAHVMRLLAGCDGQQPLRNTITDMAKSVDVDYPAMASVCADVVRKLLRAGMLLPMHPPSG